MPDHLEAFDTAGIYVGSAYLTWAGEWRVTVRSERPEWFKTQSEAERHLQSKGATSIRAYDLRK